MSKENKGKATGSRYSRIAPACKVLWRVFKILSYAAAGMAALLAVMAVVLIFVNVSAEEMLFTPYMKVVTEGGVMKFDVRLGNGIEVMRAYEDVNTMDIKGAVYAGLFTLMAGLIVCIPVFHYLGKLFRNVSRGDVLSEENASYVNYIGLSIMIGTPLVLIIKRYFNYRLIKNFANGDFRFDFGIDVFGIFLGLMIIILGTIYGYACSLHKEETDLVPEEKDD